MNLTCYCDHCPDSTCTTNENGLCYAQMSLDDNGEIIENYNCFHHNFSLVQNIICDQEINTKASSTILRCCNSKNRCNQESNFLPPIGEAKQILLKQKSRNNLPLAPSHTQAYAERLTSFNATAAHLSSAPSSVAASIPSSSFFSSAQASNLRTSIDGASSSSLRGYSKHINQHYHRGNFNASFSTQSSSPLQLGLKSALEKYSNIPLELKLVFIILSSLLLVVSLALAQSCLSRRRSRRFDRSALSSNSTSASAMPTASSAHHLHHGPDEDSLTGKASSEAAETNSMASREPLINNSNYNSGSLNHPNSIRGPWMAEQAHDGKTQSTFRMTIGTGDIPKKTENSSGSGAGQPYLTQRSIAHDIELVEVVGRGYFGVVWRGEYKGEPVAVKIFSAMAEPSWERESEIYQTTMLRHKNILGFIATDKSDDGALTGYWLVTDYYPMGSLYDFLNRNSMSMSDAIRMAFSIANGLAHLHIEIFGTQGKPAIAHRDIKSKNVLVKNDGTCCIGDLGMAVRYNSNSGIVDVPANSRVGTRRYLAPELLENRLNLMDFEAVKATDIYALGLVLWEILRRTCFVHPNQTAAIDPNFSYSMEKQTSPTTNILTAEKESSEPLLKEELDQQNQHPFNSSPLQRSTDSSNFNDSIERSIDDLENELALSCDPYEPPFGEFVSVDPAFEELREVVCDKKIRPSLSLRWTKFAPMRDYTMLMNECWYEKSQARLSALRVRKSLSDIARHYFNLNMEYD